MIVTVRRGTDADRRGIAETVVEGFYEHFSHLGKSVEKLVNTVEAGVHRHRFMVAENVSTGEIVGTVGCADETGYPIEVVPEAVRRNFGRVRGLLAPYFIREEFYRPARLEPGRGHIDIVAVKKKARGQKLSARMIQAWIESGLHERLTLDVIAGNERVLPIYEALGFREYRRPKEKRGWLKGFDYRYDLELFTGKETHDHTL